MKKTKVRSSGVHPSSGGARVALGIVIAIILLFGILLVQNKCSSNTPETIMLLPEVKPQPQSVQPAKLVPSVEIPSANETVKLSSTDQQKEQYTIYTYAIWDNMSNEVNIIRTYFASEAKVLEFIRPLYPTGVKFDVLISSHAVYDRTEITENWSNKNPNL